MEKDKEIDQDLKVKEAVPDYEKKYTYADYLTWDDEKRWELIDGVPYLMSAPSWRHQEILGNLFLKFGNFLDGKSCKVFVAPFDVRLNMDTTDDTVVQPDLVVICDKSIMMKTGCQAAPDMAIEILSPSTSIKDRALKLELYQRTEVREYWIVDPDEKLVHTHILDNGRYYISCYTENDKAPVHILDGFAINLTDVFAERW